MNVNLKISKFLLSSIIVFTTSICNGQKVETLLPDFPANGFLSLDDDGNLYASEYGVFIRTGGNGTRVFKISPEGKVLDSITNLSGPIGTVIDEDGNLFINNDNNLQRSIILKIDKEGKQTNFTEVKGWPIGMKKDSSGKMYLTNYSSPEIYKIDTDGKVSVFVKDDRLTGTAGIDFDSKGNLIVANFTTAEIFSINPEGEIKSITHLKDIAIQGWGIGHITVLDDFIYATGIAVSKIYKIAMDGTVTRFAGNGLRKSVDGNLMEASLAAPNGITCDKKRKILYISESGKKGGIRKIQL